MMQNTRHFAQKTNNFNQQPQRDNIKTTAKKQDITKKCVFFKKTLEIKIN